MSTTYGASIILGLIAVAITVVGGVKLLAAAQQVQVAADLGAISAATALATGDAEDPCSIAAQVTDAHNTDLAGCSVRGEDVWVHVKHFGRSAEAVAGPVE